MKADLADWFDRLVRHKMAGLAVCVAMIAVGCFLLTFAKMFSEYVYIGLNVCGLTLIGAGTAYFVLAAAWQIAMMMRKSRSRP